MSAYSDLILSKSSLSGYWRMGEASGTTLNDAGPNGLTGSIAASGITYGVTSGLANDPDTALTFDGTSDPASVPDNNALDLGDGPFWIAFWFKRSATQGANQTLLHKGAGSYLVRFNASNELQIILSGGAQAARTDAITDTDWHFAVINKASGGGGTIYIDGVDATAASATRLLGDTTTALLIGRSAAATQRFPGSMDELAIGKGATLSADEALQLYRTAKGAISLSDSVGSSDATGSAPTKTQADSVTASEARSLAAGRALLDSVTLTDDEAASAGLVLADQATVSDALSAADTLALGDSVEVSDDITAVEGLPATPPVVGRPPVAIWYPPQVRHHEFDLADFVVALDRYEAEVEPDPELQREEEFVLALV